MSGYEMTDKQRAYLNSLVCQRITAEEKNREIIEAFTSFKSPGLAFALREAWKTDKVDKVAYYIVKDPTDDEPLLYFSLKCGEIHIPLNREKLERSLNNAQALLDAAYGKEAPEWAVEIIEKRKVEGRLPLEKLVELYEKRQRCQEKMDRFDERLKAEQEAEGDNIIRTKQNFASVELVQFCVHDPAREKWEAQGMSSRSIGRTLFWQFVEPLIRQIRDLVGCEYLYLFAADEKRDGKLTQYYRELGFEFRDDINVNKPSYDFSCFFMCQKVTSLRNRKNEFFRNYNKPREPAAV